MAAGIALTAAAAGRAPATTQAAASNRRMSRRAAVVSSSETWGATRFVRPQHDGSGPRYLGPGFGLVEGLVVLHPLRAQDPGATRHRDPDRAPDGARHAAVPLAAGGHREGQRAPRHRDRPAGRGA